jgi:hypothetical protein
MTVDEESSQHAGPSAPSADAKGSEACSAHTSETPPESIGIENRDNASRFVLAIRRLLSIIRF